MSTQPTVDEQFAICHGGIAGAVTISITPAQLKLISRKINGAMDFKQVELNELRVLAAMIDQTIASPGDEGTVHGFAL